MKKYHVHTMLSPKHRALMEKYSEIYGTQEKVLERALESLDSNPAAAPLPEEDALWIRIGKELRPTVFLIQRDFYRMMLESYDLSQFEAYTKSQKPVEFTIEYYLQKPIKDCTLKELVDTIVLNIKIQGSAETIQCVENEDYFKLTVNHTLGLKHSKMMMIMNESVFKTYGARTECNISERSFFIKIFKG